MFCRQQVAELTEYQDKFTEAGANLIVVGNGKPEQIAPLAGETGFSGTIVTDPGRKTYDALGFRRNVSGVVSLSAAVAGLKAFGAGFRQAGVQGDALQLGGAVIISPGPALHYLYASEKAADHPSVTDMLEECFKISAGEMSKG